MLKVLNNPCTDNYYKFRDIVLGDEFNWVWYEKDVISPPGHIHMPFYGHSFLNRPEQNKFTEVKSKYNDMCMTVLSEIIDNNNLFKDYFFLRCSANCTHPDQGIQISEPHMDHQYPHYNLLVYLTGDGDTIIENEKYTPKNHDAIIFQGTHYMTRPTKGRRVVLVATIPEIRGR